MVPTRRSFRVFISSTFDDLVAERDALQRGVEADGARQEGAFARLRRLCESRGARFQAVDLRWGVSEEAALDQRTVPLCLAEVERCRQLSPYPSFVAILGDRYGWRPLPYALSLARWEQACDGLQGADLELVRSWYRRDDNAVPPVAVLQPRDGEFRGPAAWQQVEDRLRTLLEPVTGTALSATEQEIQAGVLGVPDGRLAGFAFLRTIEGLPADASAAPYADVSGGRRDPAATTAVESLRSQLRERLGDRVHEYQARWDTGSISTDHLTRLNDDVYDALAGAIGAEVDRLEELDPLDVERDTHARFAADRADLLVGREGILARIAGLRRETMRSPVAVWGVAGSGKSAVLAEAARTAATDEPGAVVICRFVGATPSSSLGPELLRGVWAEIDRAYDVSDGGAPGDENQLLSRFSGQLARATGERPLLLLLDGLDQLPDHDPVRRLTWLPDYLPPHAWVAVSTRPGVELDRLRQRFGDEQVVEVTGLSGSDGAGLLDHWLGAAGRTLQPAQARTVVAAFDASGGLPLHLRLASEEARLWASWEEPEPVATDVPALIDVLFARLSGEQNHGAMLVSRALGLLAASRNGLTEDELLDLLSSDADVMADFVRRSPRSPRVERLPVVVWSRLFADLEPYLTARSADGTVTIGFYHRELADAAARSYLEGDLGTARHQQLAAYFTGQRGDGAGPISLRVLAELPFQLARAGRLDAATDLVTEHAFVNAKVRATGLPSLVEDLDEILRQGGDDRALAILREALLLSVDALTRDPGQLSGHVVGRLALVADPRIQRLVSGARAWQGSPWLRPVNASLAPPGEPLVRILRGRFDPVSAVALSPDGRLAAGGSYGRDVRVWDLTTGLEVVHFVGERPSGAQAEGQGGDRIVDLRLTADTLVAASADSCIYVVDLRSGVGRTAVRGETDNLYAMAVVDEGRVLSAPRSIWGFGGTTLQVWDVTDGSHREIPGLEGNCAHLAVSADGRTAISRADNNAVTRWDLGTGQALGTWTVPGASVAAALSPDGTVWAVGTASGDIEIGGDAGPTHTLSGHRDAVSVLVFARPDLLVSAGVDGTVRAWDLGVGRELRCLRGHGSGVASVAVSGDGRRILSGGADGAIHVWDLAREPIGTLGRPPAVHASAVVGAAVGDDGTTGATVAGDDAVLRWDLTTGESGPVPDGGAAALDQAAGRTPVAADLRAAAEQLDEGAPRSASDATHVVTGVAVSADGRRAMTSSTDNIMVFYRLNVTRDEARVRLWDLTTRSRLRVLAFTEESGVSYSRAEAFRCVAVDATGRFGAAGGDDRTLRVWHLDTGEPVAGFTLDAAVTACAIAPDGTALVAGDATGRVHLLRLELCGWEPAARAEPPVSLDPQSGERWGGSLRSIGGRLQTDQGWVEAVAVSPDGESALVAGADGSVVRWNLVDRRRRPMDEVHGDWATAVAFSEDGRWAASGSADGTVRVWEPATGRLVDRLQVEAGGVWSLTCDRDGRRWLVGDATGGVLVWDPWSADPPIRIEAHDAAVTAVALLGGQAVASASVDGTVTVCDAAAGTLTWRSSPDAPVCAPVWAIAVIAGDLCAARQTALETWDVVAGQQRWSLETGHRAAIASLAATPDGTRVVTGSVDGEVRVTDTDAGRPLGLVLRTGWPVNTVAITPDGQHALVGGHGAEVVVVPLKEPLTVLEETIRDRFTDEEWAVVRRLPGLVWGFVASADGKVQPEEVLQMAPGAERRLPTGTPARDFAAMLLEEADESQIPAAGTAQALEAARYDGGLGLARAVLRRRLGDDEHAQVVEVLIASAREVAARSTGLLRSDVSKDEETALRSMGERL